MDGLKGLDDLLRKLDTIKDRMAKKAAKAGVNAGLTPLAQAMRSAVNASPASPELKRAARKMIGKRLKKKEGKDYVGKVGFAVGKATKAKKEKAAKRSVDKSKKGVGVSQSNIHWFVLGTKDRKTKTGHPTGRVEELLKGCVAQASSQAASAMLEAARKKVSEVLAREAAKSGG
jgi:cell division septum initiation protein DivIVA